MDDRREPGNALETMRGGFRFKDLPTELKVQIYEILLLDEASCILAIPDLPPTRPTPSKSLYPVILRVSRSIYEEALPVLYGSNTWMIRTIPLERCVPALTAYIGPKNTRLIRRVLTSSSKLENISMVSIFDKYQDLGIDVANLQAWACRTLSGFGIADKLVKQNEELEKANLQKLRKLGAMEQRFRPGYKEWEDNVEWVVWKGSSGRNMW